MRRERWITSISGRIVVQGRQFFLKWHSISQVFAGRIHGVLLPPSVTTSRPPSPRTVYVTYSTHHLPPDWQSGGASATDWQRRACQGSVKMAHSGDARRLEFKN